jgi:hypothetical protein
MNDAVSPPVEESPAPASVRDARVSVNALQAAALAAGKDETRWWLRGVRLEIGPRRVVYVATDGHILLACCESLGGDFPDNTLVGSGTVPLEVIKKLPRKPIAPLILESVARGSAAMTIHADGDDAISFNTVGGTYPAWRKIVPRAIGPAGPEPVAFDSELISRLLKAGKMLGAAGVTLSPNGPSAALVRYVGVDAFGLIAAMHVHADLPSSIPAWAHGSRAQAQGA